jgi:hypothetical protein
MKRLIIVFIALALALGQVWKCGLSEYRCGDKQVCCRGSEGFKCFNYENGVCCTDGTACPFDNVCETTKKKCIPNAI